MKAKAWLAILGLCLLALALLMGCSKKESTEQASNAAERAAPAAPATPIDPATAAVVTGNVKFDGTPPKPQKLDMSQDAACKGTNTTETIVADGGKLANVFVYVKDGLGDRNFEAPKEPAAIHQENCRYHPHVLGLMTGQEIQIFNDDPTTHNIHPTPKDNREWNESQAPKSPPINKSFAREEIMLPVRCNQHPWMKMYLNVVKHPFFAVTDKDGKFEIKGLPPGNYTLAFVHERLGEQTQSVALAAKDTKTVDVSFKQ
ncbi:MAG: carboxypeptidase regulatory-like domain-containing protein [Terriglobales bacterium]